MPMSVKGAIRRWLGVDEQVCNSTYPVDHVGLLQIIDGNAKRIAALEESFRAIEKKSDNASSTFEFRADELKKEAAYTREVADKLVAAIRKQREKQERSRIRSFEETQAEAMREFVETEKAG